MGSATAQETPAPGGWAIVAALAAVLCVLFGVTMNSFGVFLLPIGAEFGSTSEQTSRAVMVFVLCMNLAMLAAGWLRDLRAGRRGGVALDREAVAGARIRRAARRGVARGRDLPGRARRDPHPLGLRAPRYWLWVAIQVLVTPSCLGVYFHVVPYLSSVGYSAQGAARWFAATGAAALVGYFVLGVATQRWGAQRTLLFGTPLAALGILFLLLASDRSLGWAGAAAFVLLWGGSFNLINQLAPLLLVDAMGERNRAVRRADGAGGGANRAAAPAGSARGPMNRRYR